MLKKYRLTKHRNHFSFEHKVTARLLGITKVL